MRLAGGEVLQEFSRKHPDAKTALGAWRKTIGGRQFKHFVDLKQSFGTADYVKPHTVFDISGNKYRLIAVLNYKLGIAGVKSVLTHAEYDQGQWRK